MPTNVELEDEIRRLREEQQRLRDDQEKLKQSSNGGADGSANQQEQKDPGQKAPVSNGNGSPKPQPEQKAAEEPEKPKASVAVRARNYARSHPAGILIGALAIVAAAVAAFFLLRYLDSYESTDDAEVDGHLNPISVRIAGTVTGVYVEDTQYVAAGQTLVDLDQRDYHTALDQAQAATGQARAQLTAENPNVPIVETSNATTVSTTEADVRSAQAAVASAAQDYDARLATVREAEVNHTKAALDRARYQLLVDKDEISKQQFDAVVAAEKAAAASIDSAKASAEAARRLIDERRAQLAQAQSRVAEANQNAPRQVAIRRADIQARAAGVSNARAAQEQAVLNLSYTKIVAPVSGIVSQKSVEVGERVQPGEQLMTISQLDDIWITANFKETQLRQMRAGQSVDVKVDAFGTTYHGYIENLAGATGAKSSLLPPENATGNYVKVVQRLPVRIRLKSGEDQEHRLRPGMSVEPKVWLNPGG